MANRRKLKDLLKAQRIGLKRFKYMVHTRMQVTQESYAQAHSRIVGWLSTYKLP